MHSRDENEYINMARMTPLRYYAMPLFTPPYATYATPLMLRCCQPARCCAMMMLPFTQRHVMLVALPMRRLLRAASGALLPALFTMSFRLMPLIFSPLIT